MLPITLFFVALALTKSGWAYANWEKRVREVRLDEVVRDLLPEVLLGREVNLTHSGNCNRDLTTFRQAIGRRDAWALKMLDTSSKMPTGLLHGHLMDMGMFNECYEIHKDKIHGQICQYSFNPATNTNVLPFNPTLSICLPDSCTEDDVSLLVSEAIRASNQLMDVGAEVDTVACLTDYSMIPDVGFVSFIFVYVGFLSFCTYCDIIQSRGVKIESKLLQTLINFSMWKSAKSIFNMQTSESDVPVIHGIRVIHNIGIIVLHVIFFNVIDMSTINYFFLQKVYPDLITLIPFLTVYCVDTFFVLSGFLAAYGFFTKVSRGQQPSIPLYYLHRYLRLSLPMLVLLYGTMKLSPMLYFGPRFELMVNFTKGCSSKWWSYFFYAHNFVKEDDNCLLHLWSLAVDMHLFWISPLIFYPLYKNRKIGIFIFAIFFMATLISTGTIVWRNKHSAIYIDHEMVISRAKKQMQDTYFPTYTRAFPWLLGALFGYEVINKNVTPNKTLLYIGWGLAFGGIAFLVGGILTFTNIRYEYNTMLEVTFATFSRPAWAFGICWIIYATVHGFGGYVSTILSSKLFLPISRLSYIMYILHPLILGLELCFRRTPNYISAFLMIISFIMYFPLIVLCSFCGSILFERPMFVLEDLIFRNKTKDISERQKIK